MPVVEIFWGGKAIDKSKVHPFNATYTGELELDDAFNMAAPESQQFLLKFCEGLKEQNFIVANTAKCWIDDFRDFVGAASFPVAE